MIDSSSDADERACVAALLTLLEGVQGPDPGRAIAAARPLAARARARDWPEASAAATLVEHLADSWRRGADEGQLGAAAAAVEPVQPAAAILLRSLVHQLHQRDSIDWVDTWVQSVVDLEASDDASTWGALAWNGLGLALLRVGVDADDLAGAMFTRARLLADRVGAPGIAAAAHGNRAEFELGRHLWCVLRGDQVGAQASLDRVERREPMDHGQLQPHTALRLRSQSTGFAALRGDDSDLGWLRDVAARRPQGRYEATLSHFVNTCLCHLALQDGDTRAAATALTQLERSEVSEAVGRGWALSWFRARLLAHDLGQDGQVLLQSIERGWAGVHEQALVLGHSIGAALDVARERGRGRALARQASTDALTGLANRRALDAAPLPATGRTTILLVDIDHFKAVNDTFGHAVGDQVLVLVGQQLSTLARDGDLVCRLGGDELLLRADGLTLDAAGARAATLVDAVRAQDWEDVAPGLHVTVSVGVAEGAQGVAGVVTAADRALYETKQAGRDGFRVADHDDDRGEVTSQR